MVSATLVSRNDVTLTTVPASTAARSPADPERRSLFVSVTVSIQLAGSGVLAGHALAKRVAPMARKRSVYDKASTALNGTLPSLVVVPAIRLSMTSSVPLMNALYQLLPSFQRNTAPILTVAGLKWLTEAVKRTSALVEAGPRMAL